MFNAKFRSLLSPGTKVTAEQLQADREIIAFERAVEGLSRRKFMGGLTGAAALVAGAGYFEVPKSFAQSTTPPITDVLNFALNLEFLEAGLYHFASTGTVLPNFAAASTLPPTALFTAVQADGPTAALAAALLQDEMDHIAQLQSTITSLGGTPIAAPVINYAAKGAVTTAAQFLATARQFTAVGNSAYAGSAQFLVSNPAVLTAAAQILAAEGFHLGATNYQCITQGVAAALAGSPTATVDIQDQPPAPTQYFTVFVTGNASGSALLGFSPLRNTSQDLGAVYGVSTATTLNPPTGVTSGGFFPNGVNGNIKST